MSTFVNETERIANSVCWRKGDRRLENGVTTFHKTSNRLNDVERDVLRHHRESTATGNGFGHAPASNSCHIGNNHGNSGTHEIGCSEIYVEPAGDI